jgi:manganese/zinc/iron transport system ATP- binding protein
MNLPAISVSQLSVSYQHKAVLQNLSVQIAQGITLGVIGPNGAGKSTLIKALMGLVPVDSGEVRFFGQSFKNQCLAVAYVPQRAEVDWSFPIHVHEVVMMGCMGRWPFWGRPSQQDHDAVLRALETVDMAAYRDRPIGQLSGGQQQRVFIARALAQDAQIYLMDEPFAGVDMATEAAIVGLFAQLKQQGKTIVVVHHDLNTVQAYFDELILLNGRLVAKGPTREVLTAEHLKQTYGGRLVLPGHSMT